MEGLTVIKTFGPILRALLTAGLWAATLLDTVAGDATVVGAAGCTGAVSGAGNQRAIGTSDLNEAAREGRWLWGAGRRASATRWGEDCGEQIPGLSPTHGSVAGKGQDSDSAAGDGEDEERIRSHGASFGKSPKLRPPNCSIHDNTDEMPFAAESILG